jgi:hypothetical protein
MNAQFRKDELNKLHREMKDAHKLKDEDLRNEAVKRIAAERNRILSHFVGRGPLQRSFDHVTRAIDREIFTLSPAERIEFIRVTGEYLVRSSTDAALAMEAAQLAEARQAEEKAA